jgi:predicted RND superfamily exporter protein
LIHFLLLQIIYDIYNNKVQNEHVFPAINKLKSRQKDIEKVLDTHSRTELFKNTNNLIIINLKDTNTEMKKTLPLLVVKKLYEEHKSDKKFKEKSLHIIIDEAHNILSDRSERESESWKDYRLEIFEEIIKE